MSGFTAFPISVPIETWPDSRLVKECLNGSEEAWSALVEKYKRLIYSIPIKYGLSTEDAAELFKAVCFEGLSQLETLRGARSLQKWFMQTAAEKSYQCKLLQAGYVPLDDDADQNKSLPPEMEQIIREVEQEQSLREAVAALPSHCARLVQVLFFVQPAVPYAEVKKLLGEDARPSGLFRGRCLEKLRNKLDQTASAN